MYFVFGYAMVFRSSPNRGGCEWFILFAFIKISGGELDFCLHYIANIMSFSRMKLFEFWIFISSRWDG